MAATATTAIKWCYDTRHKDTQHNGTQHNSTQCHNAQHNFIISKSLYNKQSSMKMAATETTAIKWRHNT
jgi:hypothetical protein